MASHKEKLNRAMARLKNMRVNSEKITEEVVGLAISGGAAYGMSLLSAKMGGQAGWHFRGVPAEVLIGAGLYALSVSGAAGKASHHLNQASQGVILGYAARLGYAQGLGHPALPAGAAKASGFDEMEAEALLHSVPGYGG